MVENQTNKKLATFLVRTRRHDFYNWLSLSIESSVKSYDAHRNDVTVRTFCVHMWKITCYTETSFLYSTPILKRTRLDHKTTCSYLISEARACVRFIGLADIFTVRSFWSDSLRSVSAVPDGPNQMCDFNIFAIDKTRANDVGRARLVYVLHIITVIRAYTTDVRVYETWAERHIGVSLPHKHLKSK